MRRIGIKYILAAIVFIFCIGNVAAITGSMTESIQFNATIPEDHGIIFPDDALRMDHLFFRIGDVLVDKEGNVDVVFDWIHNYLVVDVIYYGNLSTDYEVTLAADSNSGWISKEDPFDYVPIDVYFNEYHGDDGIESSVEDSHTSVDVSVPVAGPRRGQKVAEMIIAWDSGLELKPGYYDMDLNLSLWSK